MGTCMASRSPMVSKVDCLDRPALPIELTGLVILSVSAFFLSQLSMGPARIRIRRWLATRLGWQRSIRKSIPRGALRRYRSIALKSWLLRGRLGLLEHPPYSAFQFIAEICTLF